MRAEGAGADEARHTHDTMQCNSNRRSAQRGQVLMKPTMAHNMTRRDSDSRINTRP